MWTCCSARNKQIITSKGGALAPTQKSLEHNCKRINGNDIMKEKLSIREFSDVKRGLNGYKKEWNSELCIDLKVESNSNLNIFETQIKRKWDEKGDKTKSLSITAKGSIAIILWKKTSQLGSLLLEKGGQRPCLLWHQEL